MTTVRVFAPDGSSFVACPCKCGKTGPASHWYHGLIKCDKGAATSQEWLETFTVKTSEKPAKGKGPKKNAEASSKASTPTKDGENADNASSGDEAKKPAKKQKVEKEPKTPKAKKAAEDTDDSGEPKLKRPMSAYFIFCEDKRKESKDANADKALTAADLSAMWKALSDEDKEPYNTKAAELKAEYDAKRPPTKTEQKQNAKADAPKRARSAYFIFSSEMRDSVKVEFPGIKVTEVAKIIGAKWKELSVEDKKKWEEMAKAEKEAIAAGGERPDTTAAGSKRKSTEHESEEAEEEADEGEDKDEVEEAAEEEKDEPVAASQAADDKDMADDKTEEAAE